MTSAPRMLLAGVVAASAVAFAALTIAMAEPRSRTQDDAPPGSLLPDLDPIAPGGMTVRRVSLGDELRWKLGFRSATENRGAGPLIVDAARSSRSEPTMTADQVVRRRGGRRFVLRGVGRLRFVRSPDHRHWHYLRFMRYELRTARGFRRVARDRKTGFCLGDRYKTVRSYTPEPRDPVYVGDCDPDPRALTVREGISVGYGDDYAAHLEGQSVDVTDLAMGRYVLVHRVNTDGALLERRRSNNASSLLISLRWTRGAERRPVVKLLARCPAVARCRRR